MKQVARPPGLLIAAAVAAALVTPAGAQTVYRCGDTYSEQPCPGGTQVLAADPRTQAQQAQARAAITRDARMAQALEAARLREEARARPVAAPPTDMLPDEPDAPRRLARVRPAPLVAAVGPAKPGAKGRGQEPGRAKAKGRQGDRKKGASGAPQRQGAQPRR